jgi:hypothetical protein
MAYFLTLKMEAVCSLELRASIRLHGITYQKIVLFKFTFFCVCVCVCVHALMLERGRECMRVFTIMINFCIETSK